MNNISSTFPQIEHTLSWTCLCAQPTDPTPYTLLLYES